MARQKKDCYKRAVLFLAHRSTAFRRARLLRFVSIFGLLQTGSPFFGAPLHFVASCAPKRYKPNYLLITSEWFEFSLFYLDDHTFLIQFIPVAFLKNMLYNFNMNKLILSEYLKSPCSVSSLPYWKQKNIVVPDDMLIIHDKDFVPEDFAGYTDERYFRLYHDLKGIEAINADDIEVIVATVDMTDILVEIINASYDDLSVTLEQLKSYTKMPVYAPDLWILLRDKETEKYIGSGIADYDMEVGELIIEWVQVLPAYRNSGYGAIIVNCLLNKMKNTAKFATVSGKVNSPTHPEKLYRKCGFTGNDVWHILRKKNY